MSRAKTIDLFKREITPISKNKRKNVYINGTDDNYPERIERVINNSVTAKMGANKMASFIVGKGFADESLNTKILNPKKGLTGYDVLVMLARSIVYQKGATIHTNVNGFFKHNYIDILPYKNIRKEKEDDLGNDGKFFYSNKWGDSSFSFRKSKTKTNWFYPFTTDKKVIKEQFESEKIIINEGSHNFRGHVYFLNFERENIYPLAFIDPAYNDADSEYHSSIFRNNQIKNGFTDKQILVCKEDSEDRIVNAVTSMLGADGSNVALIEAEANSEDLTKEVHAVSVGSDVDAERFKYFDDENEVKILQCLENIPPALVLGNDTSLLGDGGKKLSELKLNYSQDTEYLRVGISQMLKKIFPEFDWAIEPLIKEVKEV